MSNFHFVQSGAIVVAGCATVAESGALLRWRAWIAETSGPGKFRAAMFAGGDAELE